MTKTEYQFWIDYVQEYYCPLPPQVHNMDNWRHRSMVARALVRANQHEAAITLFQSIIDVKVDVESDCPGLSEVEDKVWCLKELATLLWEHTGRRNKAIEHLKEAIQLIALFPEQFQFLDRCESWHEIQNLLLRFSPPKKRRIH